MTAGINMTVAIVDDDESVRRALRRLFISLSCQPEIFASGEALLNAVGDHPPDCIILDLHLPGMTGLEALLHLRAGGVRVPVIVITGMDQPGMRESCLTAGASAYLLKPLERGTVAAVMRDIRLS